MYFRGWSYKYFFQPGYSTKCDFKRYLEVYCNYTMTSKSPRSAQVLAESVTEICFEYPFFSTFQSTIAPNSETNILHNMMTDMPSGVNRWSTSNKEDRHPGRASPAVIAKPRAVPGDKVPS